MINICSRKDDVKHSKIFYISTTAMILNMPSTQAQNSEHASSLTLKQRERLAFIDFQLYFLGELRRNDLAERFGISSVVATRTIAEYLAVAPNNCKLDNKKKVYRPEPGFTPWHQHSVNQALATLTQGLALSFEHEKSSPLPSELSPELSMPKLEILAPISRAIHQGKVIKIRYVSTSSGETEREAIPFALVNNRVRWHMRAYDRKNGKFIDLVLRRITSVSILEDEPIGDHERATSDFEWNRIISLELVPHPKLEHPEAILLDYDMPDGVLKVNVRAANVGYLMRLWAIDCSPDHSLPSKEFHLWLRDPLSIYGAPGLALAPGYTHPAAPPIKTTSSDPTP